MLLQLPETNCQSSPYNVLFLNSFCIVFFVCARVQQCPFPIVVVGVDIVGAPPLGLDKKGGACLMVVVVSALVHSAAVVSSRFVLARFQGPPQDNQVLS